MKKYSCKCSNHVFCLVEDEEYQEDNEDQNGPANVHDGSAVPSTSSAGPHSEIDAKLADFFNVRK